MVIPVLFIHSTRRVQMAPHVWWVFACRCLACLFLRRFRSWFWLLGPLAAAAFVRWLLH